MGNIKLKRLAMCVSIGFVMAAFVSSLGLGHSAVAQDDSAGTHGKAPQVSPQKLLTDFEVGWDQAAWEKNFRTVSGGFMRPLSDSGWQLRMKTLQRLVQHGDDSIPVLVQALDSKTFAVQVLAAQTLGFLGDSVPKERLLNKLKSTADPAVRLYCADSLGMLGVKADELRPILESEKHRDVKKHLNYAIERDGQPLSKDVVQRLIAWDSRTMATAAVGQAAPDFELDSINGGKVRLGDYRGKSAVVLVFLYGDT